MKFPIPASQYLSKAATDVCADPQPLVETTPYVAHLELHPSTSWIQVRSDGETTTTAAQGTLVYRDGNCYPGTVASCPITIESLQVWGLNLVRIGHRDVLDTFLVNYLDLAGVIDSSGAGTIWLNTGENRYLLGSGLDVADNVRKGLAQDSQDALNIQINYASKQFHIWGDLSLAGGRAALSLSGTTPNQAPWVDAGPNQRVQCSTRYGNKGRVVLAGRDVDPDSDNHPFWSAWYKQTSIVAQNSLTPTILLPIGTHDLTLYVDDGSGGAGHDTVQIEVYGPCR